MNIITTNIYEKTPSKWYWSAPDYGKREEGPFDSKELAEADLKNFLVKTSENTSSGQ